MPTDFTAKMQAALDHQLKLGWDQFVRGRIVTHWQELQSAHFEELQLRQTGQKWASLLIMAVWDFTWTLWDHRNDVLHNSDVHDQLFDMDTINLAIIEEWHAGGEELIPMDQMQWKGIDLETLLAKRSRFRRDWLFFFPNSPKNIPSQSSSASAVWGLLFPSPKSNILRPPYHTRGGGVPRHFAESWTSLWDEQSTKDSPVCRTYFIYRNEYKVTISWNLLLVILHIRLKGTRKVMW
jgi:hypothetical protein